MGTAPGGVVYVVSQSGNTLSAIDSTSSTVIATAPTGASPSAVVVAPNNSAYVSNFNSKTLTLPYIGSPPPARRALRRTGVHKPQLRPPPRSRRTLQLWHSFSIEPFVSYTRHMVSVASTR